jgi:hypothetical protein
MSTVRIGQIARDRITGFQGRVTAHCRFITGCDQFCLQPEGFKEDGSPRDGKYVDEQRLEVVDASVLVLDNSKGNGADLTAPVK